jgi:Resolvase, N terminal domain
VDAASSVDRWRSVAECAVSASVVVFVLPVADHDPGVGQTSEDVDVQAFVADATVERLDVAVAPGLAGRDEVQAYSLICPVGHRLAGPLGSVVAAQLAEAMQAARLGEYDVLLVWALDRLSHEGVESTLAQLRKFRQHGVSVISLQEPWTDTGDPHLSELLSSIFAWTAHAESERRSERTKAGLARRKAERKPIGRLQGAKDRTPRRRSGYVKRWESDTRFSSDPAMIMVV